MEYRFFSKLARAEVPNGLNERVLNNVYQRAQFLEKRNFKIFAFAGATSFLAMVLSLYQLFENAKQSGFFSYLSLLLSERINIVYYWKELSFSLVESMPLLSSLFLLASLGSTLLWVSKIFADTKQLKIVI